MKERLLWTAWVSALCTFCGHGCQSCGPCGPSDACAGSASPPRLLAFLQPHPLTPAYPAPAPVIVPQPRTDSGRQPGRCSRRPASRSASARRVAGVSTRCSPDGPNMAPASEPFITRTHVAFYGRAAPRPGAPLSAKLWCNGPRHCFASGTRRQRRSLARSTRAIQCERNAFAFVAAGWDSAIRRGPRSGFFRFEAIGGRRARMAASQPVQDRASGTPAGPG